MNRDLRRIGQLAVVAVGSAVVLSIFVAPAQAARSTDRDRDRMPDRWERAHGLNPRINDARRDKDHDGIINLREFRMHLDPRDADTDDDELSDSEEAETWTDPRDADSDDDGIEDGAEDSDGDGADDEHELESETDPFEDDGEQDDGDVDTSIVWTITAVTASQVTLQRTDTGRIQSLPFADEVEIGADPCPNEGGPDLSFAASELTAGMRVNHLEVNSRTLEIVELGLMLECPSDEDASEDED